MIQIGPSTTTYKNYPQYLTRIRKKIKKGRHLPLKIRKKGQESRPDLIGICPYGRASVSGSLMSIVVAATHDTSYQNDPGGIKASSRWLSEATPPV